MAHLSSWVLVLVSSWLQRSKTLDLTVANYELGVADMLTPCTQVSDIMDAMKTETWHQAQAAPAVELSRVG